MFVDNLKDRSLNLSKRWDWVLKFRTIASERTNLFYLKLKHPYLKIWYFNRLTPLSQNKRIINRKDLNKKFEIDQVAFFKKHIWCHFINFRNSGWILFRFFRKNYCQLAIPRISFRRDVNCFWETVLILCAYKKRSMNLDRMIYLVRRKYLANAKRPRDFSKFLIKEVGTFKDLSYKSTRQIRDQIMRQRPVVLWVKGLHSANLQSIVIVGFNRRLFQFLDPLDNNKFKIITHKQLLDKWKAAAYQGISC